MKALLAALLLACPFTPAQEVEHLRASELEAMAAFGQVDRGSWTPRVILPPPNPYCGRPVPACEAGLSDCLALAHRIYALALRVANEEACFDYEQALADYSAKTLCAVDLFDSMLDSGMAATQAARIVSAKMRKAFESFGATAGEIGATRTVAVEAATAQWEKDVEECGG